MYCDRRCEAELWLQHVQGRAVKRREGLPGREAKLRCLPLSWGKHLDGRTILGTTLKINPSPPKKLTSIRSCRAVFDVENVKPMTLLGSAFQRGTQIHLSQVKFLWLQATAVFFSRLFAISGCFIFLFLKNIIRSFSAFSAPDSYPSSHDYIMNLEIKGVAAAARVNARQTPSNPPAKGWRQPSRSSDKRPDDVPYLDFGKLGDSDDEDIYKPLADEYPRFGPPDSSSTISWGTPLQTPYAQHFQDPKVIQKPNPVRTELSLDFKNTVPENLPPPSDRFKLKYQQYEEEMKQNYKQYTMRSADRNIPDTKKTARHHMKKQEKEEEGFAIRTPLDEKAQLQQCYTSKPYTAQHSLRKLEAEDLAAERRKQVVVEQVMIDHLSRAVISDPEQNTSMSVLDNPQRDLSSAPLRFRKRTLHETKIKTNSTFTETMLSNRLRFDARIICRNGRDACRELIGFFFVHDKSITIYEYRQFGKNRTNALPFIQKGIYSHQCGMRSGKTYELQDFYVGANLTFLTKEHQSLADSLKQNPIVTIRITSIDEDAMSSLRSICGENKVGFGVKANDDSCIFSAIQDVMKEKLRNRGVRTVTGLGKHFRQLDKTESGLLNKSELKQALKDFHLDVSENAFQSFWLILNENHEEKMDYMIFINAVIGEMNEHRKSFVRKAFMKLDPNKSGVVSMVDLRKFYCAKKHPQVLAGVSSEDEIKSAFLETMTDACKDPKEVAYSEFEEYYEGLSIEILRDEDFINILRNCWGI